MLERRHFGTGNWNKQTKKNKKKEEAEIRRTLLYEWNVYTYIEYIGLMSRNFSCVIPN